VSLITTYNDHQNKLWIGSNGRGTIRISPASTWWDNTPPLMVFAPDPDPDEGDPINYGMSGINGTDENRLFTTENTGEITYSIRGDFELGYKQPDFADSNWFVLGNAALNIIALLNHLGTLYVVKNREPLYGTGVEIYEKVHTYTDIEEEIDTSSFRLVFSDPTLTIPSKAKGILSYAGKIWIWFAGLGLCYIEGGNCISVSGQLTSCSIDAVSSNPVVLVVDPRYNIIMCYDETLQKTYIYDVAKNMWHGTWSGLKLSCQGYGKMGIFGIREYAGIVELGDFPTTGDNIGTPKVCTPVLDFGSPYDEKFLRAIKIDGKGIVEIKIYIRNDMEENHTLFKTITREQQGESYLPIPPKINFTKSERFRTMVLEITGNENFMLKNLSIVLEERREYID
jgi:hypothetical protein